MSKKIFAFIKQLYYKEDVRNCGSGILWMGISRIFWIVNTLTVGLLVIRRLGPEKFGMLNYGVSFASLFFVLICGTGDHFISQEIIRRPRECNVILGSSLALRGIFFLVLFAAAAVFSCLSGLDAELRKICLVISLSCAGYVFQSLHPYFQATLQNKKCGIALLCAYAVYASLRLLALFNDFSFSFYVWCEVILHLTINLFLVIMYLYSGNRISDWRISSAELKNLLKTILLLAGSGTAYIIYSRTDIIMLEYFSGTRAVGFYSIAVKISDTFSAAEAIILTTLFPIVIKAYLVSPAEGEKQFCRLNFGLFYLSLLAGAVMCLVAPWMISLLFGREFLPAAQALQLYIWALPFCMLINCYSFLATSQHTLFSNICTISAGAILNIICNFWAIPRYGICGAAVSSVISLPLGMLTVMPLFKSSRRQLKLLLRSLFTMPC